MLDALVAEARAGWGLDPAAGLQLVPAERLVAIPIEPSRPLLVVPLATLSRVAPAAPLAPATHSPGLSSRDHGGPTGEASLDPLPGRHGHPGSAAGVLARLYPPSHRVARLGGGGAVTVAALRPDDFGSPLYLAPLEPEVALSGPWALPWISDRLRRPDGCPWDREQTHQTLRKHLLEEAYEVYDALEAGATQDLADELGDLLLQVVLHAQLGAEAGVFDMTDVYAAIGSKIVRRHPHVFGEAEARTASDVNRQWERIKAAERQAAADTDPSSDGTAAARPRSALDGISTAMPALAATQEMQERAAHLGYDWPTVDGIIAKLHEELGELREARTPAERHEEVGDLLLVAVNLARREGVEAEAALRAAGEKFRRRFRSVERQAMERGVALRDLDFDQLDALWMAAKAEEREQ